MELKWECSSQRFKWGARKSCISIRCNKGREHWCNDKQAAVGKGCWWALLQGCSRDSAWSGITLSDWLILAAWGPSRRMAAAAQWHSRSTQRSYSSQMKQGLRKLVRAETQKLPELCISLMCQTRLRTAISNKQQLQWLLRSLRQNCTTAVEKQLTPQSPEEVVSKCHR